MALWDKVKTELDRAGRAAQTALDEGRLRLEAFRSRQLADKAAQALGYAVYRARKDGQELDADSYSRLSSAIAGHEADVARFEAQMREMGVKPEAGPPPGYDDATGGSATSSPSSGATPPPGAPGA